MSRVKIGAVLPQTEIGPDAGAVRAYAQAVEELGYTHILAYDHVLGASTSSRPRWTGFYDLDDQFHEPLTLFAYLAAVTATLELVTGILILPQRQAALVAKQAAEVDLLSGGRLRLGVALGWNTVEYEALGVSFADRGPLIEEQIELMRSLWTCEAVSFSGEFHTVTDAGINPLPIQRPIPVWMGGGSDIVLQRIARLADGWIPTFGFRDADLDALERLGRYVRELGRDPSTFGLDGHVDASEADESRWMGDVAGWQGLGATHVSVNTMNDGIGTVDEHIERLERFAEVVRLDGWA
jgi:probable F420-dependent oxidoreductase